MSEDLLTVETVAERLQLHPKTVLRFIREGRLRATKVGKSWRILRGDVDALVGYQIRPSATASEVIVTSVVDIPGVIPERAARWAGAVANALHSKPPGATPFRADVVHDPERAHLKIIISGSPGDTSNMLGLIHVWKDAWTG